MNGQRQSKVNRAFIFFFLMACGLMASACTVLPKGKADLDGGVKELGLASWYGEDFHGWLTASGEVYDMEALTAAHRTLPLGTWVLVTNVENGKQVRVRINDRGPYLYGRVLDLSLAGARELDMVESGIAAVQLEVVGDLGARPVPAADLAPLPSRGADLGGAVMSLAEPREVWALRMRPHDLWLQRRTRRVADFQAAERRAYSVASLRIP